jgi:hypothetical protein
LVCWDGKSLDAARSSEAADENAVATFPKAEDDLKP